MSEEQYHTLLRLLTLIHKENVAIARIFDNKPKELERLWNDMFWFAYNGREKNEDNA